MNIHWNLTSPVKEAWVHNVFYYQFNGRVYNKYPIDVWENICDFLNGKREKTYGLNWMLGRSKMLQYTNFNHPCPFNTGLMYAKVDNISMDNFNTMIALIPSGRYRIDFTFTEADRVPMATAQIFFSVSDHRIEVY